jgi:hypothetical protein
MDHVADKIAATNEHYGTMDMPSTRYRDLVDLVSIITAVSVPAAARSQPWCQSSTAASWNCLPHST